MVEATGGSTGATMVVSVVGGEVVETIVDFEQANRFTIAKKMKEIEIVELNFFMSD
jgi:hypothetical protein